MIPLRLHSTAFALLLALLSIAHVSALTYKGADITSVTVVEGNGITYKDTAGNSGKMENILKGGGMNTARIRIWTAGQYNLNYGLALAKRVKAAGLTLIVDLHFSDTWADPGHQSIPSGWGTTVDSLNTNIYTYTKNVVTSFSSQGTPIDILQLGNEINDGFLWPTGRGSTGGWPSASEFLHSARTGARDAGFTGKAMLHLADGWNLSGQTWVYQNLFLQGKFNTSDIDIMGVSFYPFYGTSATLANLKSTLTSLVNTYGKDIMVAETDWPATACSTTLSETSYPKTPAGQDSWIAAISSVLSGLPGSHGKGILYWEPGWIGNANLGSSCGDNILFDSSGKARSSIDMFSKM